MKKIVITIIKGYQYLIGPGLPKVCRYQPTCSSYALESIDTYGLLRGGLRAVLRILRCNPFFAGGYDPVIRPVRKMKNGVKCHYDQRSCSASKREDFSNGTEEIQQ